MLIQDNTKHHQQSVLFPLQSFCTQRSQVYLEYETKAQVSVRMVHVQYQCAKLTKKYENVRHPYADSLRTLYSIPKA